MRQAVIIHSFVIPIRYKRFFFSFCFFSFCRLWRVMTRNLSYIGATLIYNEIWLPESIFFFFPLLTKEEWNKRELNFCSETWNEEKRVEKLNFFISLSIYSFFFILKIPTKIKSILIPSFLYKRFSLLDLRFSFTVTMLRWRCILRVHGGLYCYLQKMRILPLILSLPDFIVLATNDESEWFLFSFFFPRDKTHDWMILIKCRLLEPIIEKEIKNIRICIIFFCILFCFFVGLFINERTTVE